LLLHMKAPDLSILTRTRSHSLETSSAPFPRSTWCPTPRLLAPLLRRCRQEMTRLLLRRYQLKARRMDKQQRKPKARQLLLA
jgi:hypothetical protein